MNTPAHLIFGTTVFGKQDNPRTFWAAIAGAFAPDASLYAMVFVSIQVLGIPAQTVFSQYYYSDSWQAVFAVDNSFILWGALFGLALWRKWPLIIAFSGAALLHLAFDFPLHTHDARMHFWPISTWVFESPVSYWDSRAYAGIVGPIALAATMGFAILLWRRFQSGAIRAVTCLLVLGEMLSSGIWRLVF